MDLVHGTEWGYKRGCRCDRCRAANGRAAADYQVRADRHGLARFIATGCRCLVCRTAAEAREADRNAGHAAAPNRFKSWTGPELELVTARDDGGRYLHGARVVAEMLGRSFSSVRHARNRSLSDPRYAALAGSPRRN